MNYTRKVVLPRLIDGCRDCTDHVEILCSNGCGTVVGHLHDPTDQHVRRHEEVPGHVCQACAPAAAQRREREAAATALSNRAALAGAVRRLLDGLPATEADAAVLARLGT